MKTALVTGAAGFIGGYMAAEMASAGWKVVGLDGASPENSGMPKGADYCSMRLPHKEFSTLISALKPDACIHCAGRASVPDSLRDPAADFSSSVMVTHALLEDLKRHAPSCFFLYLSSAAVYGQPDVLPVGESAPPRPQSPYGYHKWMSELLVSQFAELHGVRGCSARIFSAFGQGLKRQILWEMGSQLVLDGQIRLIGTGKESRDFIHVTEVARMLRLLLDRSPGDGEVYNVASGVETSIESLAHQLTAAVPGAKPPVFGNQSRTGDPLHWKADITKGRALGFVTPPPIGEFLPKYMNWVKSLLETA